MTLSEQLLDYVNAAFAGIWIQTAEPDEAEREIIALASQQKTWKVAVWDSAAGLRLPGQEDTRPETGNDPLAVLRALPALAEPGGTALLLLHNFHRFLNNPEIVQTVFGQLVAGKQQGTFIVVLSPIVQIPVELAKLFVVLEHMLPDRDQLLKIARELTTESPQELPSGDDLQRVLDAAAGLTRYESEGAFALSLARHSLIKPQTIWEVKSQTLKKNNLLTLHRGQEDFSSLGGLQALKGFCQLAMARSRPNPSVKPRGIMLLSPPGCGKSQFCKALGRETGRPTLILDVGALMGSLVGQTESNVRQALRILDAMSPCIAFLDEVEKALSGAASSGSSDSGVSSRLFGTILSWMSDRESDVFVVATSNDISRLPPEFTRAERFDATFFIDLPSRVEKDLIWSIYRRQFEVPAEQTRPDDTDWTGAEIRSCCRLAALLDVTLAQAARQVVPVAVTAAESVAKLRSWASGRCLDASRPGIYRRSGEEPPRAGRRIRRDPSSN